MLLVRETTTVESAIQSIMKTHHLRERPTQIRSLYRPFWLGRASYHAENRQHEPIDGTIIFLSDARIMQWTIIGVYQHQRILNMLDLSEFQVNFVVDEREVEENAEVLEPLLATADLPSLAKLQMSRKLLARTLKLGKIQFSDQIEYHLIHRPYWEIEFQPRGRGDLDVALVSRDDILVRGKRG